MGALPVRTFTPRDVEKILGIPTSRLRHWARVGLVCPRRQSGQRLYDFRDLVCLRTAQQLVEHGLSASQIIKSLAALRARFPDISDPIRDGLKVLAFRNKIVVQRGKHWIESGSGQLVFQFDVVDFGKQVRRTIESVEDRRKTSVDWFREGLQYDSDPESYPRAIEAYLKALEADPGWPPACVNLGTIYYNLGDSARAESYYREALKREPEHTKAQFNLGNVLDDLGRIDEAIACFENVLARAPTFASAYFNLALAYERKGLRKKARQQWKLYLQYDPDSSWAEIARSRLRE